ncbi:DUF1176 domain-containing protein, partial [Salmonella enterica]|uniref:DUF1176 domain-containing protein n=1 Tax=Salmonella enterica TaxID=28901 RepID=UPI003967010C
EAMAIRLSATETLWGICSFAAAYNSGYAFWRAGRGKPVTVHFKLPGAKPDDDDTVLVNPAVSEDGMALTTFDKGRG